MRGHIAPTFDQGHYGRAVVNVLVGRMSVCFMSGVADRVQPMFARTPRRPPCVRENSKWLDVGVKRSTRRAADVDV